MNLRETHSINDIRTAIRELQHSRRIGPQRGPARRRRRDRTAHQRLSRRTGRASLTRSGRYAPNRRNVLRWNTIGGTAACTVMFADPQNHDRVIPGRDELFDRALHPHAGPSTNTAHRFRVTPWTGRRTGRRSWPQGRGPPRRGIRPSTLIPEQGRSLSFGQVSEVFCTQKETSGGSSDTGTKVLAARPTRMPSTSAAIAMTPDGKCPNASRSDVGLRSLALIASIFTRSRAVAPAR